MHSGTNGMNRCYRMSLFVESISLSFSIGTRIPQSGEKGRLMDSNFKIKDDD